MASNSSFTACPDPFIAELSVAYNGGYVDGRWCFPQTVGDETISCCFPCPITDWRYAEGFSTGMVPYLALAVLILMIISALTYILLPVNETQRHYLTSSPLMGFIFMSIAFIIPLAPATHHCYDSLTPNEWLSNTPCAVSGSFITYGVWVLVIGCFFRSLSLYLQLIWDVEPGNRFRVFALLCIFAGSLAMLGIALGVSGFSYQIGDMCYPSYTHSIGSFWGPLIAVACLSFVLQLFIMAYCIRGVITRGGTTRFSIFKRPDSSDALSRDVAPRHTSKKIWRILQLQWRAIAIACLVLLYVVYAAQVVLRIGDRGQFSAEELSPWVNCLIENGGDKHACQAESNHIGPSATAAVSALALLASCGVWGVVCTIRLSMVRAWITWIHDRKRSLGRLIRGERRQRDSDVERVPTNRVVNSPTTLEEVHRQDTRAYHVPHNSFSRPGRTVAVGTVTTISSNNAFS